MLCFPNAKINLGLNILRRRPDGYHDISTIMLPVTWRDILEMVPAKGDATTLTTSGRSIACDAEKNLVMKAFRALSAEYRIPPVDIYLEKIIPDGAGLGGGSADAAFALRLLNDMFEIGIDDEHLARIAGRIGADCPLFIYNRPMLATDTGTTLSPVDVDLRGYGIMIVKPQVSVPTAEAYAGVTPHSDAPDIVEIVTHHSPDKWQELGLVNGFERGIFARHPIIGKIKSRLIDLGAEYASMSGSGSAIFGIFRSDKLAGLSTDEFADCSVFISQTAQL